MAAPFHDVEAELWRAVADRDLVLLYQPVVDLHDATIGGVEALLRWQHESGLLAAGAFLPAIRDRQLLDAISAFVFETAAQQATTWRRRFESWLFPVSVNLGPGELSDALVERFGRLRAEHALPAGALALDISEPELLSDVSANRPRISALKEAGAQILVDDFGTTHALGAGPGAAVERSTDELMLSLVALEEFRIDVVKVDRELIDRCFAGPRDAQVIEGVVKLVHLFGCRVLAEGVESGDEAERLRRGGFDLAQGYYFQPPHGPGHIDRLLHDLADARRAFASPGAAAP